MEQALAVLQHTFGYSQFRFPQEQIIQTLLDGQDVFVLMPTGGGKSLCYQIPAILRPGVGIVISPLIALMQDQVDALHQSGVSSACLNSAMSQEQNYRIEQALLRAVSWIHEKFGVGHLVDILLGKGTAKIHYFSHQNLSTYGIGKDVSEAQWRSVYRQLVARGYVGVEYEFGQLKLEEACRPILKGLEKIEFREDSAKYPKKEKTKKHNAIQFTSDPDKLLWEALRVYRSQLASLHHIPPYMIFHDATLAEMVQIRPVDNTGFSALNGVGANKLEKYGEQFLGIIRKHMDCNE